MFGFLKRFGSSREGTSAIEFAVIAPLLIMMLAGTVEFGRLFQVYNAVNRLATQYAITWSDCSDRPAGTCNTELTSLNATSAISNIAPELQASQLAMTMFQVTMVGTVPTVVYSSPSGATMTAAQVTAAQSVIASGQSGVIVGATYSHSLQYFQTLMTPYIASLLTANYNVVQLKS